MKACQQNILQRKNPELTMDYTKPAGLTHFLKGIYIDEKVMPSMRRNHTA